MIQIFEILNEAVNTYNSISGFEVIRIMIVPIFSLITAIMAISVFSATYFVVFRIRKYLKRHKSYLNFTNKLSESIDGKTLNVFRPYETTMWGPKLEENKELIGDVLSKYKTADLKDLILGTYNDELNSVKTIINKDSKLIKNNHNFVKFQRLFHKYEGDEVVLEYFNRDYISFYKVRKSGVTIGIISKEELEKRKIALKKEVDFSEIFSKKLESSATIYKIYFIRKNFLYKSIKNPIQEFEAKLSRMRKIFNTSLKKKYSSYNVYRSINFKNYPKLGKLLGDKNAYSIDGDFLLESISHKAPVETIFSEKLKIRKEIKEVIHTRNKKHNNNNK
ncbi:MAG: hypothetical protein ACRCXE_02720 [Metamycoplasmataceae bacterium]